MSNQFTANVLTMNDMGTLGQIFYVNKSIFLQLIENKPIFDYNTMDLCLYYSDNSSVGIFHKLYITSLLLRSYGDMR